MRIRMVFTTMAADEGSAVELAQPKIEKAIKDNGLTNEYYNVFAPLITQH